LASLFLIGGIKSAYVDDGYSQRFDGASFFLSLAIALGVAGTGVVFGALFITFSSYVMMRASNLIENASTSSDFGEAVDVAIERNPQLADATSESELIELRDEIELVFLELETRSLLADFLKRQKRLARVNERLSRTPSPVRSSLSRRVDRPKLGVVFDKSISTSTLSVARLAPDSAALRAGIKAGDVVLDVDGQEMTRTSDLTGFMDDAEVGDVVEVGIWRDGERIVLSVTL